MNGTATFARRRIVPLALGLSILFIPISASASEIVTAAALKAAFLFNFAKFVEWPAEALSAGKKLALCVAGDDAVADALKQTAKGQAVEGHEITVITNALDIQGGWCHLLYVSSLDKKRAGELIMQYKGKPVFAVSDFDQFADLGGTAQLFLEGERMRFAVNVDAAQRSQLRISSRLLSLAKIVRDNHAE